MESVPVCTCCVPGCAGAGGGEARCSPCPWGSWWGWRSEAWLHMGRCRAQSGERMPLANLEGCLEAEARELGLVGGRIYTKRRRGRHST